MCWTYSSLLIVFRCTSHRVLDLQFYSADTLTLLLQEEEEDAMPVLAQLTLASLEEHFVRVDSRQSLHCANL